MRFLLSSLIRSWRAALLLVVAACATPDRASAECGDHVIILNAPASSNHDAMPGAAEMPKPIKLPCHGPNCSGSPTHDFPPLAPVAPVSSQLKELAQCLISVGDVDAPRPSFDRDMSSLRPTHRASSVFHPPRVG